MRRFHPLTSKQIADLWQVCTFSFDANVLLDFYRSSTELQKLFFDVLEHLKDRIWIPHQVAVEFFDNRAEVITAAEAAYYRIPEKADAVVKSFEKELAEFQKLKFLDLREFVTPLRRAAETVHKLARRRHIKHPKVLENDEIEKANHGLIRHQNRRTLC